MKIRELVQYKKKFQEQYKKVKIKGEKLLVDDKTFNLEELRKMSKSLPKTTNPEENLESENDPKKSKRTGSRRISRMDPQSLNTSLLHIVLEI